MPAISPSWSVSMIRQHTMRCEPHAIDAGKQSCSRRVLAPNDHTHTAPREFCAGLCVLRHIKVARHIEPRPALEMELFPREILVALESLQWSWHRAASARAAPQAKHLKVLLAQLWPSTLHCCRLVIPSRNWLSTEQASRFKTDSIAAAH